MKHLILSLALLFPSVTLAQMPQPQQQCGDFEVAKQKLQEKFGEIIIFQGKSNGGHRTVVFVNPDGSTWTIVTVDDNGYSCMKDYGPSYDLGTPTEKPGQSL